jgi:hypothetical protein
MKTKLQGAASLQRNFITVFICSSLDEHFVLEAFLGFKLLQILLIIYLWYYRSLQLRAVFIHYSIIKALNLT